MPRSAVGGGTLALLLLLVLSLTIAVADGRTRPLPAALLSRQEVRVLDLAAGAETRLATAGAASRVWWAADGRTLFFETESGTRRWRPGGAAEPGRDGLWAPDGEAVGFAEPLPGGEPGAVVWVESGGRRRPVTPQEPWTDWTPVAWSPDGARLALAR